MKRKDARSAMWPTDPERAEHAACSLLHGLQLKPKSVRSALRQWHPDMTDKEIDRHIAYAQSLDESARAQFRARFAGTPTQRTSATIQATGLSYADASSLVSLANREAEPEPELRPVASRVTGGTVRAVMPSGAVAMSAIHADGRAALCGPWCRRGGPKCALCTAHASWKAAQPRGLLDRRAR